MKEMAHTRLLELSAGVLILATPLAALAQAQAPEDFPRTAWGVPDLSGVYAEFTTAPLERPEAFGDREFLTDGEFAEVERLRTSPADEPAYVGPDTTGTEADIHYDFDVYALSENEGYSSPNRRTSIIVRPANGRIPPMLPEAEARREARSAWRAGRDFDGPEYRSLQERCIIWSNTLPPILPRGYNSNLQIYQSPGYVLIQGEMGDPRIIPTDGRDLPEDLLPQWNGTSVGRWEGDALVVETAGFIDATGHHPTQPWRDATVDLHVTERFTRIDHDTVEYAFTVSDPHTWAEPWGGVYPLTEMDGVLFEVACTEGNYGMANILSGARATGQEAAAQ